MTCKDCIHYEACVSFWFSDYEICNSYDECKKKHENDKTCVFFKSAKDVVEVRHGEWERVRHLNVAVNPYQHTCGLCGKSYFDHNKFNYPYCPNCGAKMDGERKGQK